MAQQLLIDSMPLMSFQLEEAEPGTGSNKIIMRGQFARSDKATENKRLYRQSLWLREFGRLGEAMTNRRMFGELDHPSDGRTKLARVSHLVTSLRVKGSEVIGEAEVLDTPNGRILKALAAAKAQVGVSSRGYGSTKTLADGTQEVQEDFKLDTFDFVADPATKTAIPQVFAEEREHIREAEMELTLDILKRDYPGLVEALVHEVGGETNGISAQALIESEQRTETRMAEKFSVQLRRALEMREDELRAEVRSELMSDPKVAGALSVVENIVGLVKSYGIDPQAHEQLMVADDEKTELAKKVEDQTLELHTLQQEAIAAKKLMKELAYKLHLEHLLGKDPAREAIEALIGDVTKLESKDAIDVMVKTIRAELDKRGGPASTEEDKNLATTQASLETAQVKVTELETTLAAAKKAQVQAEENSEKAKVTADKALGVAEGMEARLHAEKRLRESTLTPEDQTKVRGLCEDAVSMGKVDEIIESFKPRSLDKDEAARIRERVARGQDHDQRLEEQGSRSAAVAAPGKMTPAMLEEVGGPGSTGEFDRLAGTGSGRA